MQPAAYFAPIRQIRSEPPVEYQVEPLSSIFRCLPGTAKKGFRQGPGSGNLGEFLAKVTISQRQYQYQNHTKIT
jgi:hypothetical protein